MKNVFFARYIGKNKTMSVSLETKQETHQMPIFIIGIILFAIVSYHGWIKLQYGFNFVDEGYHATESWRLAQGDHFLDDKVTGAVMHYTLISSFIFKIYPDISLLQLRQLQFILTLASLLIFSIALFRQTRQYAWLPFVFSLFAFTGLDPIGMISNMSYQTYPHLFLVLYLSFLLFGLQSETNSIKYFFYLLSGLCLWAMNLSLLHLGLIILSPIIFHLISQKYKLNYFHFSFRDLLFVVSPFAVCWLLFIAVFNKAYVLNLFNSLSLFVPSYSSVGLININWNAVQYITIATALLLIVFFSIKKLPVRYFIIGCALLSPIMLVLINTSVFGLLPPYFAGWFSKPMWFSSLLIAFTILFWLFTIRKLVLKKLFTQPEELAIVLMVPFTICMLTKSTFSSLGPLNAAQSAIPGAAAIYCVLTSQLKKTKNPHLVAIIAFLFLLAPFYYTTARNDWDFTNFDVIPKQMNVQIKYGFGKGIYTNPIYSRLYDWLVANTNYFTQPGDYAISYVVSPMVHMITGLRPSLDDTYISIAKNDKYYEKCIQKMEERGREPKIAFIFERELMFYPVSLEEGTWVFPTKSMDFISSRDPISNYVKKHMTPASTFKISADHIIRCYVDFNLSKNRHILNQ